MNKYKVEFKEIMTYVFDIEAKDQEQAEKEARYAMTRALANGTVHFHECKDQVIEVGNVYDVTGTDDPFNPINECN